MYTVIIVEDELYVRKGLINMIDWDRIGFQVIDEADNGEDALEMIRAKRPDLVITDIRMPVLDGIQLIQAAARENQETEYIIISGHNDFSYAQQALRYGVMDYVLKPVDEEELIQVLVTISEKLSRKKQIKNQSNALLGERLVERLIRGEVTDQELETCNLPWSGAKSFTYIFVEWNNLIIPWSIDSFPPKDILAAGIRENIKQICYLSSEPLMFLHRSAFGLIIPDVYLTSTHQDMNFFLSTLLKRINKQFSLEFRIYAGQRVHSLLHIKNSYSSAKEAMQYKFLLHGNKVIRYEDIEGTELYYDSLEDVIFLNLMEAIEENNQENIRSALDRMFEDFQKKCFAPEAIKSAIVQLVQRILRIVRSMEGDERDIDSLGVVMSWHDQNITLDTLRKIVEKFTLESAEVIGLLHQAGKGNVHRIKRYIDQNYNRNINLKGIANHFYMNSAYLGQLFKKTFDVYFNEYVMQLRINAAKELLRQTDMRNYEIAEKVGFNNVDYFVSQFEKHEQMTPKEYRNRLNKR